MDLTPKNITAALVGVKSKLTIFQLQRWINEYPEEAMTAILPGAALQELWRVVGVIENLLLGISVVVIFTTLVGMAAIMFSSLSEEEEKWDLESYGASPFTVIGLLMLEAIFISILSITFSVVLLFCVLNLLQPWIDYNYGILVNIEMLAIKDMYVFAVFIIASITVSLLPAIRAYWFSINDGMTIKL